ncbi:hypothetical protein J5893_00285 [bacterium]|nr:hypothetical protein [bacterium]
MIAAELTPDAINLEEFSHTLKQTTANEPSKEKKVAIVFGNEVEGVLPSTLNLVDHIVQIPMQGIKESLNIGQSAAIFMRELGKT